MDVNGITNIAHNIALTEPEIGPEKREIVGIQSMDTEMSRANEILKKISDPVERKKQIADLEKLVLHPSEVTLKERLDQVISLEEIKQLLMVRTPPRLQGYGPHNTGRFVDVKS